MKPGLRNTAGIMNFTGYSFKATWRALYRLPVTHFPLILPGAHPLASFFILRRLKGLGFSNCRVATSENGLVVYAHR
jgi:hypothetical protein